MGTAREVHYPVSGNCPGKQSGTSARHRLKRQHYLLLDRRGGGGGRQHIFTDHNYLSQYKRLWGHLFPKLQLNTTHSAFASQQFSPLQPEAMPCEAPQTRGHNQRPGQGLHKPWTETTDSVETGTSTPEERDRPIPNYFSPLPLLGNDQDLLTRGRITLHGFLNVQGLAAAWTASFNSLVNQEQDRPFLGRTPCLHITTSVMAAFHFEELALGTESNWQEAS